MLDRPSAPRYARFHPQAVTPAEALDRATRIPRDIRQLGECLLSWELSNITRDVVSPHGDLPRRFGFGFDHPMARPVIGAPYRIRLTQALEMFATSRSIICTHEDGSVLADSSFRLSFTKRTPGIDSRGLPDSGVPPDTPIQWILVWASIAKAFELFARYEKWVVDGFGPSYREEEARHRPRIARKSAVQLLELPTALNAFAEWADDGKQAMLSWVVTDARTRGVEPVVPRL